MAVGLRTELRTCVSIALARNLSAGLKKKGIVQCTVPFSHLIASLPYILAN